jgi:hypothetical protein
MYLERHPGAARHLLIATGARHVDDLASGERRELRALLAAGGGALWLTGAEPQRIPAREVRAERWGARGLRRVLRRHRHKAHQRFSELWLSRDAPWLARAWLRRWAAAEALPLRSV